MELEKDQLIDVPKFVQHGEEDYTIENVVAQEVSGIKEQNQKERDTSDGFSDGRTMRKIMSLSIVDYLNALKLGYHLDCSDPVLLGKEVYRYLKKVGKDAGYQTVNHILTPGRSGNIIIR
jgi:hypothetical protein